PVHRPPAIATRFPYTTLFRSPLADIHFNTRYTGSPSSTGSIEPAQLVIMAVLGIFILIIACINFINLATALAVRKSREIGVRKRSEEHTSELQSRANLVCRLL